MLFQQIDFILSNLLNLPGAFSRLNLHRASVDKEDERVPPRGGTVAHGPLPISRLFIQEDSVGPVGRLARKEGLCRTFRDLYFFLS